MKLVEVPAGPVSRTGSRDPNRPGIAPSQRLARAAFSPRWTTAWVLAAMIATFGLLRPETFLSQVTLRTTLGDQAITGLLALAILLPLVVGIIDLSVANVAGFGLVLSAWLSANTGWATPLVLIATVAASVGFGLLSSFFVTKLHVNSLIVTLGAGTVALGLTEYVAGHTTIATRFSHPYVQLAQGYWGDIPVLFVFVLAVSAVMHFVFEHTPLGRRMQACGGNPVAARLSGVRVVRIQVGALVVAALLAAITGFVLAAKIGVATDSTAPGYLLPAAAAMFLGSTQIKDRPNVAGTILAILVLGTGIKGLQLLGADAWVSDFFAGAVLLLSVGVAGRGLNQIR